MTSMRHADADAPTQKNSDQLASRSAVRQAPAPARLAGLQTREPREAECQRRARRPDGSWRHAHGTRDSGVGRGRETYLSFESAKAEAGVSLSESDS